MMFICRFVASAKITFHTFRVILSHLFLPDQSPRSCSEPKPVYCRIRLFLSVLFSSCKSPYTYHIIEPS